MYARDDVLRLSSKNELINWLYHFMKQKDILQHYYQTPTALILVMIPSTFNLFDRIMVQLEKLSPLAFRLQYILPDLPAGIDEQMSMSNASIHSNKNSARDWVMTISRRASKTLTQPIVQSPTTTVVDVQPSDTLRSTFTRKINSLFTKTNPVQPSQRKNSSAVTAKLPVSKPTPMRTASPAVSARARSTNIFANATAAATTTSKPVIVASPKLNNPSRAGSMRRGISPSVAVTPTPPLLMNTPTSTFQSKIPRPSLNVDKPKSARYRSTALPPK
jgi:hypothetical protein